MFKVYLPVALVFACVACGSSFSAGDGAAGSSQAGEANGGEPSSAGSGGDAGATDTGGTSSGGDGGSAVGGAGASAGNGGATVGGAAGSTSGGDCAKIKAQYQTALEKARVCDEGSTQQCSPSSTVDALSCGCPVLVNAKSEYTATAKKARQAYQDARCVEGIACAAIACAPIAAANCAATMSSGSSFVCSAVTAIPN